MKNDFYGASIVFFGPQGSGKGTQSNILIKKFDFGYIPAGDLLRRIIKVKEPLGKQIKKYLNKGQLVPDNLIKELISGEIKKIPIKKGIVFDGYPRNLPQAIDLDEILQNLNRPEPIGIYLDLARPLTIKRLSKRKICRECNSVAYPQTQKYEQNVCRLCGGKLSKREDDVPETIEKRLNVYFNQTLPIIGYFKDKNKLMEINAGQTIQRIHEKIVKKLREYFQNEKNI